MKSYKFLKTAQGARDGINVETFQKDQIVELEDDLAAQFLANASAVEHQGMNPADARETKVDHPAESKEGEAGVDLEAQNIEELVAVARDTYGLEVDSTMDEDDIRALIEDAEAASEPLTTESVGGRKKTKRK